MRGALVPAVALVASLWAGGCGEARPPPYRDGTFTAGPTSTGGFGGDGGAQPPGCGQQNDGSYCDCVDVPLFTDPPNLYFVLDRSGSMADDNKWSQVRVTVAKVLRDVGARANFGATVFPGLKSVESCAPGDEILSIRQGDPPSGGQDGPTTAALLAASNVEPAGGTPTAATLQALLPKLKQVVGKTFVILATDGGPNCDSYATCGVDQCIPNIENVPGCAPGGATNCCMPPDGPRESCLDAAPTTAAVQAMKDAGLPVYVIGIPGSAPYANLLDALATAGGTANAASPKYFKVDVASTDALLAALKKVTASIVATCNFTLKSPPAQPDLVNVYLDEVVLPQDPVDGWKIDGSTVTLLGTACERVKSGDVLDVRIIAGCPTVQPR